MQTVSPPPEKVGYSEQQMMDIRRTAFIAGYETAHFNGDAREVPESKRNQKERTFMVLPPNERKAVNDEFDAWVARTSA